MSVPAQVAPAWLMRQAHGDFDMTRKDYEIIAAALKEGTQFAIYKDSREARSQHALQCSTMALALRFTNASLNRFRFLTACGLSAEDIEAL
jgi:hypothetical protein